MTIRDEQAHETASMYYLQGQTIETIVRHPGISRSPVSRLLFHARETGLARISVSAAPGNKSILSGQISEIFGIQTSIVPVHDVHAEVNRLHNVSLVAVERLVDMLKPGVTPGIAWGNTTSEITRYMPRMNFSGSTVIQPSGATTATESDMPYVDAIISRAVHAIGGRIVHFLVPTFFSYAETKDALWHERSVQAVLKTIEDCDIALFDIDPLSTRLPSHVHSGGFLDTEELAVAQRDGVVGNVRTVLLRKDGSTDMVLNSRASGPTPETLRRIPRRLCVVTGASKALPLLGTLRTKIITNLVLDDGAVHELLELIRSCVVQARGAGE